MPTCKQCHWARVAPPGDPRKGFCIASRTDFSEKEATTGVTSSAMQGKYIMLTDEACEKFEPKKSRKEYLKDGY